MYFLNLIRSDSENKITLRSAGFTLQNHITKGSFFKPSVARDNNLLVWLYLKNMEKENTVEVEGDDQFWTSNASPVTHLFQNNVMFLLKIMLIFFFIYDESLLSSQPPLSGHLLIPRGCSGSLITLMEVQLHSFSFFQLDFLHV